MTLEAFADTILPGEKRHPDDLAIAGVSEGGGAVAAGAVELLEHPSGGFADSLGSLMFMLNLHAGQYAAEQALQLDPILPAFVALPYEHRAALVTRLTAPGHAEKAMWVGLAMFATMAFDAAAHLTTTDALAAGHPGLTLMGYAAPEADGVWRFPQFSYGRQLAKPHPNTTSTGSPA
ncbi:MAG: regulator [Hamadaea sp.]|uniref:DUF5987 family protein n=1 Tax=Hamadaea sp. NPDC050747 TaxID=3155789 RepID=UPI0017F4F88B|nr:regulator [Hamadaea sp.]NUR47383.1 regulator [Hamadaea sp.]NUT03513.1 regulator [Hamadaea sp.]